MPANPLFSRMTRYLAVALSLLLTGCLYGPERYEVWIEDRVIARASHTLTIAVDWAIVRDPQGLAAFPNGGLLHYEAREARLYRIDVDTDTIQMIARLEDYGGIPVPKSIELHEWQRDGIHFTIRGYGSKSSRSGDDMDDPRVAHFHVPRPGEVVQEDRPPDLPPPRAPASGLPLEPPFLSAWGHGKQIDIALDEPVFTADKTISLVIDDETGEPILVPRTPRVTLRSRAASED